MSQFKEFGVALKAYRVAANETIEDVSGAVEIEPTSLEKYEQGAVQPPQPIIDLLVRHFSLRNKEAERLMSLAGYINQTDELNLEVISSADFDAQDLKTVVYTDMIHVISNKYGVIMNFIQGFDNSGDPQVVSRVGMSREHAKSVLEVLKKSLEKSNTEKQG